MHERCRVYTFSPDVGPRLEKTCMREWCTHGITFSQDLAAGVKKGMIFFFQLALSRKALSYTVIIILILITLLKKLRILYFFITILVDN
jgi:hypothetical protein